jgi:hypothetical protein
VVEIAIRVYEPIVHKRVNGRFLAGFAADRLHVFGNWFAADGAGENGDSVFHRERVAVLAKKGVAGGTKIAAIGRTGEKLGYLFAEQINS